MPRSAIRRTVGLPSVACFAVISVLAAAQSASAIIYRPVGATPVSTAMVIAYTPCTTATPPGNVHNPANIAGGAGACSPPAMLTTRLTVGNPNLNLSVVNFRGNAKLSVKSSTPINLEFPAGPPKGNYYTDVRCSEAYKDGPGAAVCTAPGSANNFIPGDPGAPPDYTGDLDLILPLRITDQSNSGPVGGPYTADATMMDVNFAVALDCAVTAANNIGASCLPRHTDANALCGCIPSGKRMNIEIGNENAGTPGIRGGIHVMDGGTDGNVADLVDDTGSPAVFARQGVFLP